MREIFKMVVGSGSYILNSGEYIEPELQSNQALRIRSGILMHHGGIAEVKQNTYDEVTIGNGTQGMKRIDLVVARYTKDPETEHETMTWVVIQGTPAASDPAAPAYTEGDMQNGDLTDDCPVFEVHLDGIQVTEVVKLVEILDCDLSSLNGKMPVIQSGTGTLAYANYAVCTARVTFPEPFDEIPDITITPIVPSEGSWNSTRNSITNSTYMIAGKTKEYFDVRSFSIQDDYTESLTIQFDWTAKL